MNTLTYSIFHIYSLIFDCNHICQSVFNALNDSAIIKILIIKQARQPYAAPHYNNQAMQMSSFPPHSYASNPNQPMLNTVVQSSAASNMQGSESNPCSGLASFVINIPSYIFGGTQMSAINVNLQPVPLNQQVPLIAPERNIAQNQATTTVSIEQKPTTTTCQQL